MALWREPKGPPKILDEALKALAVMPEHRDRWRGKLHYIAMTFLMHWYAEQNAPRRKDMIELLDEVGGWHTRLGDLDVETFNRLSNAMGESGPGTLDELVDLLRQLRRAATALLRQSTPPDKGGRSNLVTERHGTAHGQLVLDLIQRMEAGIAAGEIDQGLRITGGTGGGLVKVACVVCRYATGDDHTDRVQHYTRHATPAYGSPSTRWTTARLRRRLISTRRCRSDPR